MSVYSSCLSMSHNYPLNMFINIYICIYKQSISHYCPLKKKTSHMIKDYHDKEPLYNTCMYIYIILYMKQNGKHTPFVFKYYMDIYGYDIPLKHILTIKNHIYLHMSHDYNPTWIMFDPIRSKKESTEALLALEVLGATSSSSTLGHLWAWL